MKRRFTFKDEKSSKFWEIESKDKEFTVTFGKIGTDGQSKTKTYSTAADCDKEVKKLISEKTKKGYKEG